MCEHSRDGGKHLDTDCETLQLLEVLWPPCSVTILKLNLLQLPTMFLCHILSPASLPILPSLPAHHCA